MKRFIKALIKLLIVVSFAASAYLIFKNYSNQNLIRPHKSIMSLDEKSEALRKYLLSNQKPARIEIVNLSSRFENDVELIKKLKIPQDKNSTFYISIQFFTDETDVKAPLIAQIRFIDLKTGNTIKEESLNLD